jgi:hypothetical protein
MLPRLPDCARRQAEQQIPFIQRVFARRKARARFVQRYGKGGDAVRWNIRVLCCDGVNRLSRP